MSLFDLADLRLSLWQQLQQSHEYNQQVDLLSQIYAIEVYWAYPGKAVLFQLSHYLETENTASFALLTFNIQQALANQTYKKQEFLPFYQNLDNLDKPQSKLLEQSFTKADHNKKCKTYFEVLIIHPNPAEYELLYRNALGNLKTSHDPFLFDVVFVDNYQDALIAILANCHIQVCIYLAQFKIESALDAEILQQFKLFNDFELPENTEMNIEFVLQQKIKYLRPEIDHYFISEVYLEDIYHLTFDRIIMGLNLFADLHRHILSGIEQRYSTPFFDALRNYALKPKGAFHALPISQGQSINHSSWISDIADFYGQGIFAAETSSTLGGMDSLMDPKGSISQAQNKAAKVFQSLQTYFITNGTTSANKIVMQANLHPNDIVLVSADCHKSIPYSTLLTGACPIFLETYPLNKHDLYGCVTLERIKAVLMDLKIQGKLHQVRQITLTNSTFDGIIYNVKRFMLDILAIKPDIIFHWDEAWFAFAYFNPLYNHKTAMGVAHYLIDLLDSQDYHQFYQDWVQQADLEDPEFVINNPLYPDPELFKVRVYATQSTHKTLTAFRQASMLHIHDVLFDKDKFNESYRTHTSTSPNYQIIASLDFARRQISLEGYELTQKAIQLACDLRNKIKNTPLLTEYFSVLEETDLIPEDYLINTEKTPPCFHYHQLYQYNEALFNLDPTRITLDISATGIDGPNFRQLLMTQYDIQVNKTSNTTILLIINIGVSADNMTYLLESLKQIASKLKYSEHPIEAMNNTLNLPQTRLYHPAFIAVQSLKENNFQAVQLRHAYYMGMLDENIDYVLLSNELIKEVLDDLKIIAAAFITPYPPGFPIIVPGQIISYDLLLYLKTIKIKEIHGYHPEKGIKVFTADFLKDLRG